MFKFFKKKKEDVEVNQPNFEIELTAAVLAYEIARSDGEISEDELSVLMEEIGKISMKVGKEKSEILEIVEIYSKDSVSFHEFIEDINDNFSKDQKLSLLKFMWKTAYADGRLDVAANELFKKKKYSIHSKKFITVDKTINRYLKLIQKYKIKSIEDPFAEDDWLSWNKFMKKISKKTQIVGDDLYVTNLERLKIGFLNKSSNSILIKLNQIGTVSETLEVIKFAQLIGFSTIISHRSGDSEDTFISDLAVGTNSNQIKTGSLARSERVAKYNQLIRIEEKLGKSAKMNKIN